MSKAVDINAIMVTFRLEDSIAFPISQSLSPEYPARNNSAIGIPLTAIHEYSILYASFSCIPALVDKAITVRAKASEINEEIIVVKGNVTFDYNGISINNENDPEGIGMSYIPLRFFASRLFQRSQGVHPIEVDMYWEWQLENSTGVDSIWHGIKMIPFVFLITYDKPKYPWGWNWNLNGGRKNGVTPLLGILKYATFAAKGATSLPEIARNITSYLISSSGFTYSLTASYTKCFSNSNGIPISLDINRTIKVFCQDLNAYLDGYPGNGNEANCFDMAYIQLLLNHVIGGEIKVGRLENSNDPSVGFKIKQSNICTIGGQPPPADCFQYHIVNYIGDLFDESAKVFDSCLWFVDNAGNETYAFGIPLKTYIHLLAENPDDCNPQIYSRKERIQLL